MRQGGEHEAWAVGMDGEGREVESGRVPFVVRGLCAGLQQVPETLEHAAHNLGGGFFLTIRRITLPLIMANMM